MEKAIKALIPDASSKSDGQAFPSVFALNTTHTPRREIVKVDGKLNLGAMDLNCAQKADNQTLLIMEDVYGTGIATPAFTSAHKGVTCTFARDEWVLENESLRVKVSKTGRLTSILDLKLK